MSASNHHLKSLSHSPSTIGLIFSIIDQFTDTASFYDNGSLIRIEVENGKHKLKGNTIQSKLFSAFVNWIGHIMSDIAGSSGASARGAGIAIPFYELLQGLNFGKFDINGEHKTLADIAVKVFEQGYDFRFGIAQSIPVLMVEMFIRVFAIVRHRYQYNYSWSDCLEFLKMDKSPKLRKMLLVGQGCLCLIDAGDAFIREGYNWILFFSRLNFIAWMRFSYLGLRHSFSILNNDIELMRYKLRKEAFDGYLNDIETISNKFIVEHNKKVEKYYIKRREELDILFLDLKHSLDNNNYEKGFNMIKK